MAMSRKHYEAIAREVHVTRYPPDSQPVVQDIAQNLADVFATDNPNFDRQRFYRACGITK